MKKTSTEFFQDINRLLMLAMEFCDPDDPIAEARQTAAQEAVAEFEKSTIKDDI